MFDAPALIAVRNMKIMLRMRTFDNLNESNTTIHADIYVRPFKELHLAEKCAPERSIQYCYAIKFIYLMIMCCTHH